MWRIASIALIGCGRIGFDSGDAAALAGPSLARACDYSRLAIVHDGVAVDDNAATTLPDAIQLGCMHAASVRTVMQTDPGILDPATDRPLLGPTELGLVVGGTAPQRALHYLQLADSPLIVDDASTNVRIIARDDGRAVVDVPWSALDPRHDVTIVMYVCAAVDGTCVVAIPGEQSVGTVAGVYFFEHTIVPQLGTARAWYVIDWRDSDGDLAPSAGDTFTVVGSG